MQILSSALRMYDIVEKGVTVVEGLENPLSCVVFALSSRVALLGDCLVVWLSSLVLSCLVLSSLVLSCLVLSCLVLSCPVLSCLFLSSLTLLLLVLSCRCGVIVSSLV